MQSPTFVRDSDAVVTPPAKLSLPDCIVQLRLQLDTSREENGVLSAKISIDEGSTPNCFFRKFYNTKNRSLIDFVPFRVLIHHKLIPYSLFTDSQKSIRVLDRKC